MLFYSSPTYAHCDVLLFPVIPWLTRTLGLATNLLQLSVSLVIITDSWLSLLQRLVVWRSGCALASINEINLRRPG